MSSTSIAMCGIHKKPGCLATMLALAALFLCIGCAHQPPPSSSAAAIWATYAHNVPHAVHQRIDMFSTSETVALIVRLPAQWVTVSIHDAPTGRVIAQQTCYVPARSDGVITLNPLRRGEYIVRASQEGVLKAESQFSVR